MRFGSVCSGIEAASVAWSSLGWSAAWFAEIAPFPSKVLAHRHPQVVNHDSLIGLADRLAGSDRHIDVLVGGTPCQSFSVAGFREGLADARGNLALEFCRLAAALRPRWVLWENVPGVLTSNGGRDFAAILGALVDLGYGCAWRVLDARFFGVPQRRRRLFLVGHLGNGASAGAVLFEPEGTRWNPEATLSDDAGADAPGGARCFSLTPLGGQGAVLSAMQATISTALTKTSAPDRCVVVVEGREQHAEECDLGVDCSCEPTERPGSVRFLTALERERLQGFPDGYTALPESTDAERFSALGNSMAVPVMRWIGERIAKVDALLEAA